MRRLEFNPASAYVLEEVRYVYAAAENQDGPLMATSEKPPSINEKGVFGPSTIAYLAQAKFERHLPAYRLQEEMQTASTMWFSRSVLCGGLLRAADGLQPLRDLLLWTILNSFYLRADETTGASCDLAQARPINPTCGSTAATRNIFIRCSIIN